MSSEQDDTRVSFNKKKQPSGEQATLGSSELLTRASARRTASRTEADIAIQDNSSATEHDRVWQVLLAQLLGRLEFGRTSLENPTHSKNPVNAVRVAMDMVNEVAQFITEQIDPQTFRRPLSDALAAAGRFLTAANVAAAEEPRRGLLDLFKSRDNENKRQECMWVLGDLPLVLERYFTMLGSCFKFSQSAIEWVDTSGMFLTELKKALVWVEIGAPKPSAAKGSGIWKPRQ